MARSTLLLNEALADIFAAHVEHDARPGPDNFTFGEELAPLGHDATRDHIHPAAPSARQPQIEVYEEGIEWSAKDPHETAGIVIKAWSLMLLGGDFRGFGVPEALGWDKSEALWFSSLTSLTRSPARWLLPIVAARQVVKARSLRWSQRERDSVACAWRAVGVLDEPTAKVLLGSKPVCFSIGGEAAKPTESSCAGQPDGHVCNSVAPYSAFVCERGQSVGGIMCSNLSQRCKRASATDWTASLTPDGKLSCE